MLIQRVGTRKLGAATVKAIWRFVTKPQNLAVLVAIAGALGFLWKEILAPELFPKEQPVATAGGQIAVALNGSTAVNAKDQAVVHQGDPTAGPVTALARSFTGPQRAEAKAGGRAVNAAGSADVTIEHAPGQ